MDTIGRSRSPTVLVGREREIEAIDRLIDLASLGESQALLIRGEAGIGKTALLDHAEDRARSMTVLRTAGVEAESDLGFAGVYGLVRPILGHLDEVPEAHAAALAGALGLAPSPPADRFLVSAGVLGLLAAAAEQQPVLCLVDDAQWLDHPSAEALVFAARRLRAEPVAMLFAVRAPGVWLAETPDLPELTLGGLDEGAAAAILARRGEAIGSAVRGRLLAEARGNPLALLELPAALSPEELAGAAPLPDAIPLTPRLQAVFKRRLDRLPEATQLALRIAAANDIGDLTPVLRAAESLGLAVDALEPSERADLILIRDGTISFRHPLVRSVVYAGATTYQRQQAHAALAGALTGEENADRRVWHQAMATLTADDEVAAALEVSARRARARAAPASAATAWLRAAELSSDKTRRQERLAAAAQACWDAGQVDRTRDVVAQALPGSTGEVRAKLLHLQGVVEWRTGSFSAARSIFLDGANTTRDPSLELEMLFDAADVTTRTGELDTVAELGRRVERLRPATEIDQARRSLLAGLARMYAGEVEAGYALIDQGLERARALEDPRTLIWAAEAASAAGEPGEGLPYAGRAVDMARRLGRLNLVQLALGEYAFELFAASRFEFAYAAAEEGYRLCLEAGHPLGIHLANKAVVEAVWGREETARDHIQQALGLARRRENVSLQNTAEWVTGFIDLTLGRHAQAADRLLRLTRHEARMLPALSRLALPDAVEAGVRAGRRTEASERLASLRGSVDQAPTEARRALTARCEALVGSRPPAEAFAEAVDLAEALPPFQRARTELLFGEWLRRERRRQDARTHLRLAVELFDGLRAVPWQERAEAELRATGESTRKRDPSTLDQLTPQELQIGSLVADGLTNREIAAQLYLSPRTVDYHLRKVFAKLGIASRTELMRAGLLSPGGRSSP